MHHSRDMLVSLFDSVNEFHDLEMETNLSTMIHNQHASIEACQALFRLSMSQLKASNKEKIEA